MQKYMNHFTGKNKNPERKNSERVKKLEKNLDRAKKILPGLLLSFCCLFFHNPWAQAKLSLKEGLAIGAKFKQGRFQMEDITTPRFMSGPCYQIQSVPLKNHPNSADVILYPHNNEILFYGGYSSSLTGSDYASLEEVIEKNHLSKKIKEEALKDVNPKKFMSMVKGRVAFWDMSSPDFLITHHMVQDHQDPNKALLVHRMDDVVSFCELEIKEFE